MSGKRGSLADPTETIGFWRVECMAIDRDISNPIPIMIR